MKKQLGCPSSKVFSISIMVAMGVLPIQVARAAEDGRTVGNASLVVYAAEKSQYPIPRYITGKFCEHLYFNVTNGM